MIDIDPDVVTGYNICNFDFDYLFKRAHTLQIGEAFSQLSKLMNFSSKAREQNKQSNQTGAKSSVEIAMPGRIIYDLYQIIRRDHKLRSYKLNAVAFHFLKQLKEDVHHSSITPMWRDQKSNDGRDQLAVYCLRDALLPVLMFDKLLLMSNTTQLARVTGVPFSWIDSRGAQIKTFSLLLRETAKQNVVIPTLKMTHNDADKFKGATVVSPDPHFFPPSPIDAKTKLPTQKAEFIATMDFQSLYPSIMIAYNMCYSTYVPPSEVKNWREDQIHRIPDTPHVFVRASVRQGILPLLLQTLLSSRKTVKKQMGEEKDPFKAACLNGQQLAFKVASNASYGFTGAKTGFLYLVAIAESVTAVGRDLCIERAKQIVEQHFTKANGYEFDAKVVYGDTDSIFINFGPILFEKAMENSRKARDLINAEFKNRPPMGVCFEKIYNGYCIWTAKRYAGHKLDPEKPLKGFELDTKGLENVRRDNCLLVSEGVQQCLNKCLVENDIPGAARLVVQMVTELVNNQVDMGKLIDSRCLSRTSYKTDGPHVVLAAKLTQRDPGTAPRTGDRVAFVMLRGGKKDKKRDLAEDPMFALKHQMPLDINYYLERLETSVSKVMEPFLGAEKTRELFHGEHARGVVIHNRGSYGPMMKFLKKTGTCLGCKMEIKASEPVCLHCEDKRGELHKQASAHFHTISKEHDQIWDGCLKCAGDTIDKQICANNDCQFFWKRQRLILDKQRAQSILHLF